MSLKQTTLCLGYQQIALSAVTPSFLTVPKDANFAMIIPEAQAIRYRDDGVAPTAIVGMPISANQIIAYDGDLKAVQFIAVSAGAILNVLYYF